MTTTRILLDDSGLYFSGEVYGLFDAYAEVSYEWQDGQPVVQSFDAIILESVIATCWCVRIDPGVLRQDRFRSLEDAVIEAFNENPDL